MVAASVCSALRIYVAGLPGSKPIGGEEGLITTTRGRRNQKFGHLEQQNVAVNGFLFGVEPLVKYLDASTPKRFLETQGKTAVALHVYESFKIVSSRTRLMRKYAEVIDSEDAWYSVESGLMAILGGERIEPPAGSDGINN